MDEWTELMSKDIMTKTLREGEGPIAEMNYVVECDIILFLDGNAIETVKNERFKIGEGDAIPGLELSLRHSRLGETFRVRCSPRFAWGQEGRPATKDCIAVPPDSSIECEIKVLKHISPDNISIADEVELRKECGNRWFRYSNFTRAARCFSQGAQKSEKSFTASSEESSENVQLDKILLKLYIDCLNNLAACHLSLNDPYKTREACIKVLEVNPTNSKALLRAGRASLAMHDYDDSRLCLNRLLEIQQLQQKHLQDKDKEMFSAASTGDVSKANDNPEVEQNGFSGSSSEIATTMSWIRKLNIAEKQYKLREKEMSKKISSKLFPPKESKKEEAKGDAGSGGKGGGKGMGMSVSADHNSDVCEEEEDVQEVDVQKVEVGANVISPKSSNYTSPTAPTVKESKESKESSDSKVGVSASTFEFTSVVKEDTISQTHKDKVSSLSDWSGSMIRIGVIFAVIIFAYLLQKKFNN